MAVSEAYVNQIVQAFLPFAGKEVPDDLVETWQTLDADVQGAVRDRLRAILDDRQNRTPSPIPKPNGTVRKVSKRDRLIAALQRPGWHSVPKLSKEIGSSEGSIYGMLNRLVSKNHPIVKGFKDNSIVYRYGADKDLLGLPDPGILSRSARGAMGANAARGKPKRTNGTMESHALGVLERAGDAGLTVEEWAAALNSTTGGMYRRITTLRRRGHDIGLRPGGTARKRRYIWRGTPDTQSSLFNEAILPTIIPVQDVADLFGVHKNTLNLWVRTNRMPPPEVYTRNNQLIRGWEESVVEKFIDKPPGYKECPHCGSSFKARGGTIYCSVECREMARAAASTADAPVAVPETSEDKAEAVKPQHQEMVPEQVAETDMPSRRRQQKWLEAVMLQLFNDLKQARLDADHQHETVLKSIKALKAEKEAARFPVIDALYTLDQHLSHGFSADTIVKELNEGSDASTIRDWLWKLQGKIKRLAQTASEHVTR